MNYIGVDHVNQDSHCETTKAMQNRMHMYISIRIQTVTASSYTLDANETNVCDTRSSNWEAAEPKGLGTLTPGASGTRWPRNRPRVRGRP